MHRQASKLAADDPRSVQNGAFAGGTFDWATPFAVACGLVLAQVQADLAFRSVFEKWLNRRLGEKAPPDDPVALMAKWDRRYVANAPHSYPNPVSPTESRGAGWNRTISWDVE
jgi:hypothetical protein